jgi:hypothetical protein
LDGAQALPALGLDSLMVMELRNVVKQDTGVLLQQDALLNFPSLDGLSVIILSGWKLGGLPSTNTGLQTSAKTVSDRVDAISGGFIDTAILLHARCASRGFLVRRDREAAGRGATIL